jgi:hypothetical protein
MLSYVTKAALANERERTCQIRVRVLFKRNVHAKRSFHARAKLDAARLRLHFASRHESKRSSGNKHNRAK